ncbi:hypothetical protein HYW36_02745 [Candidatus Saccharibacteria bacterium]|nr:hypothetical protein [Candidatus Saccharibacteria bacterium]
MKTRTWQFLLPAVLSAGSFLALLAVVLLTNPVTDISYAVLFFGLMLTLLLSGGYLIAYLRKGKVAPKTRFRIGIFSVIAVVFIMFLSTGSFSIVDGLIMLLVAGGLFFYSGRRT